MTKLVSLLGLAIATNLTAITVGMTQTSAREIQRWGGTMCLGTAGSARFSDL